MISSPTSPTVLALPGGLGAGGKAFIDTWEAT
jgi:hypothetical protein